VAIKQKRMEQELQQARAALEIRIQNRAGELAQANQALQAEIAQRRRVQEAMNARAEQQAAVVQIGQLALSGRELAGLFEDCCALVARTLGVEFCKILELAPAGETLLLRAGVGWKNGLVGHAMVNGGFNSQAGYTLLSSAPVVVDDLRSETRFKGPPLLHEHGVASGMSVVIPGRDRPFGVLGAHTTKQHSFSADDVHFLEAVANVLSDAIERKQDEDKIHRGGAWLQSLIETTQDAVISIDRQGRIVLFNPSAERIFGYTKAEIQGQKVNVLMAEPYATEHDQYVERYEKGGEPRAIGRIRTVEARRKNGETFPFELSVTQVTDSESDEVHYAAFIRDISELRRGQRWLQSLINATQDAVLSIDRQGRIVLFNPSAEQIFGYTREEVIGQKVNLLMAEPYQSEHDGYIERYERTGVPHAIGRIRSVTARRKNGELFPIELSVTKVAEDTDVQYAAFIRDISEKTKLQAQVVESERLAAIGTTAAKIGHELGNPLNGMSLTIQLLESRLSRISSAPESDVSATIRRLKNEIARLNHLTGEFRTISRREKYDFQPTQISVLIEDIVNLQAAQFERQGIRVENIMANDLPPVSIDADKINQALLNIIKNALEAMPNGGTLRIEAQATASGVKLEITDSGMGIPLDVDAFEPFMTTKKEGTGVGLVIVRQIIVAHGGNVSYRSRQGEGTTFIIELPLR
jgi:PAS domain S-box-containing protein